MAKPQLPPGYSVRYRHDRLYIKCGLIVGSVAANALRLPPSPRGGVTTAFIFNEDRELVLTAQAVCHLKDNFCKRIGRDIALGRAIQALNKVAT